MKRITLYIILILQLSFLAAQNQHFSKSWGSSLSENPTDIFEVNKNAYFVPVRQWNENQNAYKVIILKLDSNCNVIDSLQLRKHNYNSSKIYILNDFFYFNNHIIGRGFEKDTITDKKRIWLVDIDEDLNIIRDTILGNEDTFQFLYTAYPLITSQNQLILTFVLINPIDSINMVIWMLDSNFNIIKENSYSTLYEYGIISVIEMASNQSFHIITENEIIKIKQNDLNVDSVVWKRANADYIWGGPGAIALNDSVYIHPVNTSFYQPPYWVNFVILYIRDKNGNLIGSKVIKDFNNEIELSLIDCIAFSTNDSIFVTGTTYSLGSDFTVPQDNTIFLWNFSINGTVNWQKYYSMDKLVTVSNITKTTDGGCFITGTVWDWHNSTDFSATDIFFLKVDINGNVTGSLGINEKIKQSEILVYPNPAQASITFNTGMYSNYQLSIFNALGQTVLQQHCSSAQNTFSIQDFQQGMYYYRLLTDHGKVINGKFVKE